MEQIESEIWKSIMGYEDSYEISNYGNLRSKDRRVQARSGYYILKGQPIRPKIDKDGYLVIGLSKKQKVKWISIHRLVAMQYIPNPDNLPQVNHKYGNKLDNYYKHLEWNTCKQNIDHACKNGLRGKAKRGEDSNLAKLSWNVVNSIRNDNNEGMKQLELSQKYNTPESTIYKIITNRTWQK